MAKEINGIIKIASCIAFLVIQFDIIRSKLIVKNACKIKIKQLLKSNNTEIIIKRLI